MAQDIPRTSSANNTSHTPSFLKTLLAEWDTKPPSPMRYDAAWRQETLAMLHARLEEEGIQYALFPLLKNACAPEQEDATRIEHIKIAVSEITRCDAAFLSEHAVLISSYLFVAIHSLHHLPEVPLCIQQWDAEEKAPSDPKNILLHLLDTLRTQQRGALGTVSQEAFQSMQALHQLYQALGLDSAWSAWCATEVLQLDTELCTLAKTDPFTADKKHRISTLLEELSVLYRSCALQDQLRILKEIVDRRTQKKLPKTLVAIALIEIAYLHREQGRPLSYWFYLMQALSLNLFVAKDWVEYDKHVDTLLQLAVFAADTLQLSPLAFFYLERASHYSPISHVDLVKIRRLQAALYFDVGAHLKGQDCLKQVTELPDCNLAENVHSHLYACIDLAHSYQRIGQYDKALKLLQSKKALDVGAFSHKRAREPVFQALEKAYAQIKTQHDEIKKRLGAAMAALLHMIKAQYNGPNTPAFPPVDLGLWISHFISKRQVRRESLWLLCQKLAETWKIPQEIIANIARYLAENPVLNEYAQGGDLIAVLTAEAEKNAQHFCDTFGITQEEDFDRPIAMAMEIKEEEALEEKSASPPDIFAQLAEWAVIEQEVKRFSFNTLLRQHASFSDSKEPNIPTIFCALRFIELYDDSTKKYVTKHMQIVRDVLTVCWPKIDASFGHQKIVAWQLIRAFSHLNKPIFPNLESIEAQYARAALKPFLKEAYEMLSTSKDTPITLPLSEEEILKAALYLRELSMINTLEKRLHAVCKTYPVLMSEKEQDTMEELLKRLQDFYALPICPENKAKILKRTIAHREAALGKTHYLVCIAQIELAKLYCHPDALIQTGELENAQACLKNASKIVTQLEEEEAAYDTLYSKIISSQPSAPLPAADIEKIWKQVRPENLCLLSSAILSDMWRYLMMYMHNQNNHYSTVIPIEDLEHNTLPCTALFTFVWAVTQGNPLSGKMRAICKHLRKEIQKSEAALVEASRSNLPNTIPVACIDIPPIPTAVIPPSQTHRKKRRRKNTAAAEPVSSVAPHAIASPSIAFSLEASLLMEAIHNGYQCLQTLDTALLHAYLERSIFMGRGNGCMYPALPVPLQIQHVRPPERTHIQPQQAALRPSERSSATPGFFTSASRQGNGGLSLHSPPSSASTNAVPAPNIGIQGADTEQDLANLLCTMRTERTK